jgi:hypothetical protein
MNSHYFEKTDPDLHRSEELVSDPHPSQKLGDLDARNGAMEAHLGAVVAYPLSHRGSQWSRQETHSGALEGLLGLSL